MLSIKLTQVCSDKSEFLAETQTRENIDLEKASYNAKKSPLFENVTFLRNTGVLRLKVSGKSVLLFGNGRITVNCVEGLQEASLVLYSMMKSLELL